MALLRLFILAVLVYLLFYLLFGARKNKKSITESDADAERSSVTDVLVEDPICHKLVPKGQAVRLRHNKEIIYFCSEECCEIYEKNQKEKE